MAVMSSAVAVNAPPIPIARDPIPILRKGAAVVPVLVSDWPVVSHASPSARRSRNVQGRFMAILRSLLDQCELDDGLSDPRRIDVREVDSVCDGEPVPV